MGSMDSEGAYGGGGGGASAIYGALKREPSINPGIDLLKTTIQSDKTPTNRLNASVQAHTARGWEDHEKRIYSLDHSAPNTLKNILFNVCPICTDNIANTP